MQWFYDASVLVTMPLFVGGFVVASCAVVLALRPVVRRMVDDPEQWDRVLEHVTGAFGVFFGILLALVAVSVYENFSDAQQATLDEAAEVGALFRASGGLPDELGIPMRASLEEYVHTVINQDFPTQREDRIPTTSTAQVAEFERLLHGFEPQTPKHEEEFGQLLKVYDDFIEARRARIDATTLALPVLFWWVIWVGAAVNAVLISFIFVKRRGLHLLMAGMLALFIGLVIYVTADMDHPYAGAISVGPGAFERVLEQTIE